jgi:uncharacterized protein with HEPN domain
MGMTGKRTYTDYLHDMLDYADQAEQFVAGMRYEQFETDRKTQLAVLYAITIIGEAANKIPASVRDQYPSVPWRTIIDTRNRLLHGYEDILWPLVWNVIRDHIPPLKAKIIAILAEVER